MKKRLGTDVRTSEEKQSVGKNEMGKWKGKQALTDRVREREKERETEREIERNRTKGSCLFFSLE